MSVSGSVPKTNKNTNERMKLEYRIFRTFMHTCVLWSACLSVGCSNPAETEDAPLLVDVYDFSCTRVILETAGALQGGADAVLGVFVWDALHESGAGVRTPADRLAKVAQAAWRPLQDLGIDAQRKAYGDGLPGELVTKLGWERPGERDKDWKAYLDRMTGNRLGSPEGKASDLDAKTYSALFHGLLSRYASNDGVDATRKQRFLVWTAFRHHTLAKVGVIPDDPLLWKLAAAHWAAVKSRGDDLLKHFGADSAAQRAYLPPEASGYWDSFVERMESASQAVD